ncbi:hypothetical protein RJ640_012455 [Escallonia rubra]|uniref:Integrase zinc-binding domain-containing protein n=1 Tax=Escallonia rubra TaxID=112253 RepID=A0AA88RCB7_9ASTE|nr:hypothetical protein RJ640_012455 [Escallonia rubra]
MASLIKEKEKAECETVHIGSIQVLNALQKKNVPQVPTGEGQASKSEGLLYMEAKLNGKPAHVLMDTGATHNFITMEEAKRLGLNVVDGGGWLKIVNAEAKPLQGTVRRVEMCLGKWKGFVNFSVARMDDFKVVLGLDFLRQVNALVSPYACAMCIMERGAACVVPLFGGTSSTMTSMRLSGMRLVQEVEREEAKKSEGTYLASLKVEDRVVLHEFEKRQPPRRKVGDQGKLDRRAKLQNVVPCGMAPPKEEKLLTTSKAKGEIIKLIKEGLQRDPLAKELLQLVKSGKTQRYRVKGDLLYTKDGRVYVPKWRDLRKMVIRGSHDTQSTVHPGHRRTYALVTTAYFWPQMKKEVQMCVKTCHVCRQVKGESQAEEAKLLDTSQVLHDLQRREAEYVLGDRLEQGRDVPPKQHYLQWVATAELRRREPHDLAFAMVIVERLKDFKQGERPRSPRHERAKYGGKSGSPTAIDDEWSRTRDVAAIIRRRRSTPEVGSGVTLVIIRLWWGLWEDASTEKGLPTQEQDDCVPREEERQQGGFFQQRQRGTHGGFADGQCVALAMVGGLLGWAYVATKPPPAKVCGSPGGPPVTSPRIKLSDGRHLAYKETGIPKEEAKHKIIVVHGFDSSKDLNLPVSQELIEELRIYFLSFDRAGYGESDPHPLRTVRSEAFDIEELADKLQIGPKLSGASLVVPFVNYWWPCFPANLSKEAFKMLLVQNQWAFRVAHYVPWVFNWWMTQKWFPSLSALTGNMAVFSRPDLEMLKKLAEIPSVGQACPWIGPQGLRLGSIGFYL